MALEIGTKKDRTCRPARTVEEEKAVRLPTGKNQTVCANGRAAELKDPRHHHTRPGGTDQLRSAARAEDAAHAVGRIESADRELDAKRKAARAGRSWSRPSARCAAKQLDYRTHAELDTARGELRTC
jgi:hypothetical protein